MNRVKFLTIVILLGMLGSLQIVASPMSMAMDNSPSSIVADYEAHDPILITSDADFVNQSWPGSGTLEDPYVIEGLSISVSHDQGYCIEIKNVQSHFVVRNCFLYGTSYTSAIVLRDTMNGLIEYN